MKSILKGKVMMVVISLVCAITMLMIPNLVLAADTIECAQDSVQPRWSCLLFCDNGIDYASDISKGIVVLGATQTYSGYYAEVEVQLQKYVSGIWVDVPTYYWHDYQEDTFAEAYEDNVAVSSGVYRCSVLHTAYDPSGFPLEDASFNTVEITIP